MIRSTRNCINRLGQRRLIHNVPKLTNQEAYTTQGINGLYSAKGFNTVWTDYQHHLTKHLTQLTMETENETRVPFHILQNTAKKPDQAHVFNYASQAFNNHLFIESLTEPHTNNTKPSLPLMNKIEQTFENLDGLKEEILHKSESMLGSGWVFLVEDVDKGLYVISCYNAGSPFDESRQQMFDLNSTVDEDVKAAVEETADAVSRGDKNHVIALLALNLWEQAYLPDYSVSGRAAYVEKWWDSINWNVVNERYYPSH